jgi:hypothetical protein
MSANNALENDILEYIFKNTTVSWDAATDLYVSLHTGDPSETGTQLTSEATYGSYARVAVARSGAGWTVTTSTSANTAAINFPQCTSGSETITYFGIGTASSGAGKLLYSGALTASRLISSGIAPQVAIGALTITVD